MSTTAAGPASLSKGMSSVLQRPLAKCAGASVCVPECSLCVKVFVSVELGGVAAVHDPEPEGVRAGPRQGVVLGHPGMGGDSIRRSPSKVHLATRW